MSVGAEVELIFSEQFQACVYNIFIIQHASVLRNFFNRLFLTPGTSVSFLVRASTSQIFFRSTAHSCLLRLEHNERSIIEETDFSLPGAFDKIP